MPVALCVPLPELGVQLAVGDLFLPMACSCGVADSNAAHLVRGLVDLRIAPARVRKLDRTWVGWVS